MDPRLALFNPYLQEAYGYGDDPRLHLFVINELRDDGFNGLDDRYNPDNSNNIRSWRGPDLNTYTGSQTSIGISRYNAKKAVQDLVNGRVTPNSDNKFHPGLRIHSASAGDNPYKKALKVENPNSVGVEYEPRRPPKKGG